MAITASQVTSSQTLEEFRLEYNKLQADVLIIKDNPTFSSSLVFEGDTADAYETTLNVIDPTADRSINLPNNSGTLLLTGGSSFALGDGGTYGVDSATDAMTVAASGAVTFAARPIMSGGVTIADGGTIGSATTAAAMTLSSAGIVTFADDILIKDGGTIGSASSAGAITIASSGIVTFVDDILLKNDGTIGSAGAAAAMTISSGGIVTFVDDILIKDAGTIGSASSAGAITIASTGIVTFVDDILIKDAGTIGNASVAAVMTLASTGIVTFVDDIILKDAATIGVTSSTSAISIASTGIVSFVDDIAIKDDGTIGTATDADAITIAAAGAVTLSQRSVHSGGITVPDDGQIGSASDLNAIAISSAGVVTLSATAASSSKTTGALVVAGGIGTSADLYVGDLLNVEGDIYLAGSNKELRFYEGANYVGFEAPALSANQIWVLPTADASTDGDVLMSNASGTLSFSTAVSGTATVFATTANNSANETVYPVFVDGATGAQGAETDTGLTYNPSTGLITTAKLMVADGGTIGSASSASAISIAAGGVVTFVDDIVIKDGGTIGSASAVGAITLDASGNATFSQNLTVTGVTTLNGNLVLGDAAADTLTIGATLAGANPLIFEGATADAHETTFTITDPTGDRTITFPDASGTVGFAGVNLLVPDAGTIGSASDTNAIGISAGGVVSITATTASTSATSGALTVAGGAGVAADLGIGDDLFMISDGAVITFGANSEIKLTHVHDTGLSITSTAAAPLVRRGEDVYIVLDQTAAAGTDAGDNVIMDRSAADTDVGDDIIGEDEVFLHSGMQRNVLQIKGSNGKILNSVAGFAPGAI